LREAVVCDSSCLIALERIGHLDLLPALFHPVQAPPTVLQEFGASPEWLRVEAPTDRALVVALGMLMDAGEAEAVALASERGWPIILDDRQARAVARRLDLQIVGTVAVLIRAKRQGLIEAIGPLLDDLAKNEFRLSEALRQEALRLAGE
jgi:predicted nucleic acid-binding protein